MESPETSVENRAAVKLESHEWEPQGDEIRTKILDWKSKGDEIKTESLDWKEESSDTKVEDQEMSIAKPKTIYKLGEFIVLDDFGIRTTTRSIDLLRSIS